MSDFSKLVSGELGGLKKAKPTKYKTRKRGKGGRYEYTYADEGKAKKKKGRFGSFLSAFMGVVKTKPSDYMSEFKSMVSDFSLDELIKMRSEIKGAIEAKPEKKAPGEKKAPKKETAEKKKPAPKKGPSEKDVLRQMLKAIDKMIAEKQGAEGEGKSVKRTYKISAKWGGVDTTLDELHAAFSRAGLKSKPYEGKNRDRYIDVEGDPEKIKAAMAGFGGKTEEVEPPAAATEEPKAEALKPNIDKDAERKVPSLEGATYHDTLEVDDYPYGRSRTKAKFSVETMRNGNQRGVMQTMNPKTGKWNKPKKTTSGRKVKIVQAGGRTYIATVTHNDAIQLQSAAGFKSVGYVRGEAGAAPYEAGVGRRFVPNARASDPGHHELHVGIYGKSEAQRWADAGFQRYGESKEKKGTVVESAKTRGGKHEIRLVADGEFGYKVEVLTNGKNTATSSGHKTRADAWAEMNKRIKDAKSIDGINYQREKKPAKVTPQVPAMEGMTPLGIAPKPALSEVETKRRAKVEKLAGAATKEASNKATVLKPGDVKRKEHKTGEKAHKRAKKFQSKDSLNRASMTQSVVMNLRGERYMVSTDGNRLAMIPVSKDVKEETSYGEANIGYGAFPDVARVIPSTDQIEAHQTHHFDAKALLAQAKLAAYAPGRESGKVHFFQKDGKHSVQASTSTGDHYVGGAEIQAMHGTAHVEASGVERAPEIQMDTKRAVLNAKFIADALQGATGSVAVHYTGHDQPLHITRSDGEVHIIMPMRLDRGVLPQGHPHNPQASKSFTDFSDLLKAKPTKYKTRKRGKDGKWVYTYAEKKKPKSRMGSLLNRIVGFFSENHDKEDNLIAAEKKLIYDMATPQLEMLRDAIQAELDAMEKKPAPGAKKKKPSKKRSGAPVTAEKKGPSRKQILQQLLAKIDGELAARAIVGYEPTESRVSEDNFETMPETEHTPVKDLGKKIHRVPVGSVIYGLNEDGTEAVYFTRTDKHWKDSDGIKATNLRVDAIVKQRAGWPSGQLFVRTPEDNFETMPETAGEPSWKKLQGQLAAAATSADAETLSSLNDWGVKTLREFAETPAGSKLKGFDENPPHASKISRLIDEETARLKSLGIDPINGLGAYLKASRSGSSFRLSRKAREAVFAVIATRAIAEYQAVSDNFETMPEPTTPVSQAHEENRMDAELRGNNTDEQKANENIFTYAENALDPDSLKFVIEWSESGAVEDGQEFASVNELNAKLQEISDHHRERYGLGGGYFKTKVHVELEGNRFFTNRLDVTSGGEDANLVDHMTELANYYQSARGREYWSAVQANQRDRGEETGEQAHERAQSYKNMVQLVRDHQRIASGYDIAGGDPPQVKSKRELDQLAETRRAQADAAEQAEREAEQRAQQDAHAARTAGWEAPQSRREVTKRVKRAIVRATGLPAKDFYVRGARGTGWVYIDAGGKTPEARAALDQFERDAGVLLTVFDDWDRVTLEAEIAAGIHTPGSISRGGFTNFSDLLKSTGHA